MFIARATSAAAARRRTSRRRCATRCAAERGRETKVVSTKPDFGTHFILGIEHFNALRFWEAHEAWEELWLAAETDIEQYLQGLIQLAAAYHHLRRGTLRGGVRLFDAALRRLSAFPNPFCGLDRDEAVGAARAHREWAAQLVARRAKETLNVNAFPKLHRLGESQVPPSHLKVW